MPNCPCAPSPVCPIPQGTPSLFYINHDAPLPMCPVAHMSKKKVKLSKRCQVVKKISSCQKDVKCQKVKHMDYGGGSQKKINWHEVHTYWCQFCHHIWWWPKTLKMCIESGFEQFWWPSYLTSKLTSICVSLIMWIYFFVNLLQSLCVWLFDIWHLFDILTSFLTYHLGPSQGHFWWLKCRSFQGPKVGPGPWPVLTHFAGSTLLHYISKISKKKKTDPTPLTKSWVLYWLGPWSPWLGDVNIFVKAN